MLAEPFPPSWEPDREEREMAFGSLAEAFEALAELTPFGHQLVYLKSGAILEGWIVDVRGELLELLLAPSPLDVKDVEDDTLELPLDAIDLDRLFFWPRREAGAPARAIRLVARLDRERAR